MDYYIDLQGEDKGPYTLSQLHEMWNSGAVTSDTIYCTTSMTEWRPLSELILATAEKTDIAPQIQVAPLPSVPPPVPPQDDFPQKSAQHYFHSISLLLAKALGHSLARIKSFSVAVRHWCSTHRSRPITPESLAALAQELSRKLISLCPPWLSPLTRSLRGRKPMLVLGGLGVVTLLATLAICLHEKPLPPNVTRLSNGEMVPDPGYRWRQPDSREQGVTWSPGSSHPQFPHVFAGESANEWKPGKGYVFVDRTNSLAVRWSPGLKHPNYPHVFAAAKEGIWDPEFGYDWATTNQKDLSVVWSPGMKHSHYPHVFAASREGYVVPEAGYQFRSRNTLETDWSPGLKHPDRPHVMAARTEGLWVPETGFEWTDPGPKNDLSVRATTTRRSSQTEWSDGEKIAAAGLAIVAGVALLKILGGGDAEPSNSGWFGEGTTSRSRTECFMCNGDGFITGDVEVPTTQGMRLQRRTVPCPRCNQ